MKNFLDDKNATYDALAKRVLSRKAILAQILKYSVEEYSNCELGSVDKYYLSQIKILAK